MTDQELFILSATILYGNRWKRSIAKDLKLSERTINRYTSGERKIPSAVWSKIEGIAVARSATLCWLLPQIAEMKD